MILEQYAWIVRVLKGQKEKNFSLEAEDAENHQQSTTNNQQNLKFQGEGFVLR